MQLWPFGYGVGVLPGERTQPTVEYIIAESLLGNPITGLTQSRGSLLVVHLSCYHAYKHTAAGYPQILPSSALFFAHSASGFLPSSPHQPKVVWSLPAKRSNVRVSLRSEHNGVPFTCICDTNMHTYMHPRTNICKNFIATMFHGIPANMTMRQCSIQRIARVHPSTMNDCSANWIQFNCRNSADANLNEKLLSSPKID